MCQCPQCPVSDSPCSWSGVLRLARPSLLVGVLLTLAPLCALACLVDLGAAVLKSCEVITEQSVASDLWQPTPAANDIGSTLLKYLRLIVGTQKLGLESVVDDMVIHLFAALGFNTGKLLILSVHGDE